MEGAVFNNIEPGSERPGLSALQDALLEMLYVIDGICRKYGIGYMLFAGSALGAVRHGGFIPWDDDLDIMMLRPDYERFLEVAPQELDAERYFLQKEFTDHWPMFFSKLRKNNTTCMERYIPKDPLTHQGIYVDIFPCDNLSDNGIMRLFQYGAAVCIVAKSLDQRGYLTRNPVKKLLMRLCRQLSTDWLLQIARIDNNKPTQAVHVFFSASVSYSRNIFLRCYLTETVKMNFAGGHFPISRHYDALLRKLYGDYWVLPTESERQRKVHGVIVDLERPYMVYLEQQKNMKIKEYFHRVR